MSGRLIHGRASTYVNRRCRCPDCRAAWAVNGPRIRSLDKWRASNLAAGLTMNGEERSRPYDERALALMARFGLEADGRFVP